MTELDAGARRTRSGGAVLHRCGRIGRSALQADPPSSRDCANIGFPVGQRSIAWGVAFHDRARANNHKEEL
jgi:hypothetical protein